jgi:hypothetical protein
MTQVKKGRKREKAGGRREEGGGRREKENFSGKVCNNVSR